MLLSTAISAFDWPPVMITLGLMLLAALVGGAMGLWLKLPKVTSYLLVGLALGPFGMGLLLANVSGKEAGDAYREFFEAQLAYLIPLERLAMALVLFQMGCHFTLAQFRRILHRVSRISLGELGLTFLLVTGGLLLLRAVVSADVLGREIPWQMALLLGVLALATAPATTILVLKENQSEGPVTEYATALVALNNLVCVLLFEVLFLTIRHFDGELSRPISQELLRLARDILGGIGLGMIAGLAVSYASGLVVLAARQVLLIAAVAALLGICQKFDVPFLLTFLAMGATVANAADQPRELLKHLDQPTKLFCVVFFVIHGSHLNVPALYHAGLIGVAYIVLRTCGKVFGIFLTAGGRHEDAYARPWLSLTMLAQAGAAITLASMAADPVRGLGQLGVDIKAIIVGTVVFFEILGPIALKFALLKAGEVPLGMAIRHDTTTPLAELGALINRLMVAAGFPSWKGMPAGKLTIGQVMQRNPKSIDAGATFDDLVDFIERSRDNTFPVTDKEGQLVGVIRYQQLRNALFDAEVGALVAAHDLLVPPGITVHADDPLTATWEHFRSSPDDTIPVVSRDPEGQLVGIVRRKELMRMFSRPPG